MRNPRTGRAVVGLVVAEGNGPRGRPPPARPEDGRTRAFRTRRYACGDRCGGHRCQPQIFGDLRVAARGGDLQVMTLRDSWALA